ncbi:MAG: response regulator [Candidatus Brocadiae bacterium]|nr:response regulator [Candidatus Brocadiia bacterium]
MSRVLIADDSPFMRRMIKEILTEGGYTVIAECQNGLEAVDQYKKTQPDLVLMDYNMPQLNGIEGAKNILQYDANACIVMVTSLGSKKKIIQALRIGVKNYITKPFENQTFLSTLHKVMGKKAPVNSMTFVDASGEFQVIGSFLGQYLLQKGVLSKEQLLHLLEVQAEVNRKIGQIATDEALMLPAQVETILKVQKRINKYFGQLAVQMGFINSEQLGQLLRKQQKNYIELDEIIVRENMLPKEVLAKEMARFKMLEEEDQGVFNMSWVSKHIENGFIYETFIEQTLKLVMRLAGIFVMEGQCFFDRSNCISHGILIKMAISGDHHWSYYLSMSENLAASIAQSMIEGDEQGNYDNYDSVNLEAAKEFVNIACGNAIGKLDTQGIKLEISPPVVKSTVIQEKISFQENEQVLQIPILVPEGEMELFIVGVDIFRQIKP